MEKKKFSSKKERLTSQKKIILDYEPNMFIVLDGLNDLVHHTRENNRNATPILWKERWMEICDIGKDRGFDTLITLQAAVNTGKQVLTKQELSKSTSISP